MGRFYVEIEGLSSHEQVLISALTIFNVKAQVAPREKETLHPIAAVREYLQPIFVLNRLERKLCDIVFPLASVFMQSDIAQSDGIKSDLRIRWPKSSDFPNIWRLG